MPSQETWETSQRALRRDIQARRARENATGSPQPPDLTVGRPARARERSSALRSSALDAASWFAQRLLGPVLLEQGRYNREVAADLARQRHELEVLRAASRPIGSVQERFNAFDYLAFEDRFRGSQDAIAERQREYVPYYDVDSNVLDIGCGRGEFLDMLQQRGTSVRGVDASADMVAHARARGLDVRCGDATEFLASEPDASIGGVFMAQVVEHLESEELMALMAEIGRTTAPGAVLIVETLNPESWPVLSRWFWLDPSHVRLVHPETLQFFFEAAGFDVKTVQLRNPVDPADRIPSVGEDATALSGPTDYFVVGTRRG